MHGLSLIAACTLLLSSFIPHTVFATSIPLHSEPDLRQYYTRHHSLGEDYAFDPREWQSINVTDLSYKYDQPAFGKRSQKTPSEKSNKNTGGSLAQMLKVIDNEIKAIGDPETVKITWYTGHDLENPSCWPDPTWAPTDNSFACALTLHGWNSQPSCFKFLELCNGPQKCVFVRVVDSCAGCAPGSKHVDLTKAAFSQLADPDEGVLNVQMRHATEPKTWFEDLWGPTMD